MSKGDKFVDGHTAAGEHVEAWRGGKGRRTPTLHVDGEELEVARHEVYRDGGSVRLTTVGGDVLWAPQNTLPADREYRPPTWCGQTIEGQP